MNRVLHSCLVLSVCMPFGVFAQAPTTVQKVAPDKEREKNYVHEVKIIQEFIERFNNDSASYINQEYKKNRRGPRQDREKMLVSLFNNPRTWEAKPEVRSFIDQVTDTVSPQFLSFTDSNWYAEVTCQFNCDGKAVTIPLVLQLVTLPDSAATWMITGIGNSTIFSQAKKIRPITAKQETVSPDKSISPSDYAQNFLQLYRVFSPAMNPANYFTPSLLQTERAQSFSQLIQSGRLKFSYAPDPKFHFFQVPNYVFVVSRFDRKSINSGWLISSLHGASPEQKLTERERLLQRAF